MAEEPCDGRVAQWLGWRVPGHLDLRPGGWLRAGVGDCGGPVAVALARGIGDGALMEPVVVGHASSGSRRRPTATTTTGAKAAGGGLL